MPRKKTKINYFREKPENEEFPGEEKSLKKLEKKREGAKHKARLREVRKVLLGNAIPGEDNRLKPVEGFNMNWWGTADGSFGTRLFGIAGKTKRYRSTSLNNEQVVYRSANVMSGIGRGVDFDTVYEGCSCLLNHFFFRPVVLIFEHDEADEFTLTAYCGRDILVIPSIRRAIKLFENNMPDGLEEIDYGLHDNES